MNTDTTADASEITENDDDDLTPLAEDAFKPDGTFNVDGSKCKTTVVKVGGPDHCGRPGFDERCEFHFLLATEAQKRLNMRTTSNSVRIVPKRMLDYADAMRRLVKGLKADEARVAALAAARKRTHGDSAS